MGRLKERALTRSLRDLTPVRKTGQGNSGVSSGGWVQISHKPNLHAPKIVPPRPRIPCWKGLGADSEEKHEPVSDIDTAVVDSLKVLDLKRPIREADIMALDRRIQRDI